VSGRNGGGSRIDCCGDGWIPRCCCAQPGAVDGRPQRRVVLGNGIRNQFGVAGRGLMPHRDPLVGESFYSKYTASIMIRAMLRNFQRWFQFYLGRFQKRETVTVRRAADN